MNLNIKTNNTSGYKGVVKSGNRWRSQITKDKKYIHIGLFLTPKEAANAYNKAATKYFGKYACLNCID